jgi:hypothetical protein
MGRYYVPYTVRYILTVQGDIHRQRRLRILLCASPNTRNRHQNKGSICIDIGKYLTEKAGALIVLERLGKALEVLNDRRRHIPSTEAPPFLH